MSIKRPVCKNRLRHRSPLNRSVIKSTTTTVIRVGHVKTLNTITFTFSHAITLWGRRKVRLCMGVPGMPK
jgi:hypothetical protein